MIVEGSPRLVMSLQNDHTFDGSIPSLIELIGLSHEFLRAALIASFFSASSLFHYNLWAIQGEANQRLRALRHRATKRFHSSVRHGLRGSFV